MPAPDDAVVRFDKNLDGDFSDTILTAAGANAFSPGFCAGAAATALPSAGCTEERSGFDVGARAGYDWQAGGLVIGALGELSFPDHVDSTSAFSTTPAFYTFTRELNLLGGIRARAGFGGDRALIYGTGGFAWGRIDHSFATSNVVNTFVQDASDNAWGYQAGGGVELRWGRLTAGAEYLFTDLTDEDRFTVRAQGPAPATNPFILTNSGGTDLRRSDSILGAWPYGRNCDRERCVPGSPPALGSSQPSALSVPAEVRKPRAESWCRVRRCSAYSRSS